jgi:hypothetical protein
MNYSHDRFFGISIDSRIQRENPLPCYFEKRKTWQRITFGVLKNERGGRYLGPLEYFTATLFCDFK